MSDLISRQAAIMAVNTALFPKINTAKDAEKALRDLPPAQPHWIPCSERLPEDLSEVNVTWINTDPEPYYDFIKGERFTGSAVYYKGKWYWYSSTTKDVLVEYGRYDSEEFDEAIECIAWMPLPTSYMGDKT